MFNRFFITLGMGALLSTGAYAQTLPPSNESVLCESGYVVFFGNGVFNDLTDMRVSLVRVRALLGQQFNDEPIIDYKNSINRTEPALSDLIEAFEQKRAEDPTLSWDLFFRFLRGQVLNQLLEQLFLDYFDVQVPSATNELRRRLAADTQFTDATVQEHMRNYESELLAARKVLIVAHSQGNLYANAAYRGLQRRANPDINLAGLGIAAVATPANEVADGSNIWITSDHDLVIDAVRALIPATLRSNDTSVPLFPPEDLFGHNFIGIYTNRSYQEIRTGVVGLMRTRMAALQPPLQSGTAGPITATLNWNVPGDVDLHTFEPTGAHVYYASRGGSVGFLDRDDIVGTGPEHYFSSCQNFVPGPYTFGVNYFSGNGSRTATIKLSVLGQSYPARSVTLTQARGSDGDSSPTILFSVRIDRGPDGQLRPVVQ